MIKKQKSEVVWNIVNSLLAGGLVFLGGLLNGGITKELLCASAVAAGIIVITKFSDYWKEEESEYTKMLAKFI
jgi:hypothetical protein